MKNIRLFHVENTACNGMLLLIPKFYPILPFRDPDCARVGVAEAITRILFNKCSVIECQIVDGDFLAVYPVCAEVDFILRRHI